MPFVHLQVKSAYSLLSSSVRLDALVQKAKQLQYKSLALTDDSVMYGVIPFYKLCMKEGIKPIIGLTIQVVTEDDEKYTLVLLAENNEGYRNLVKISSAIQTKTPDGLPERWLKSYAKGLIALFPSTDKVNQLLIMDKEREELLSLFSTIQKTFHKDCFFLGIEKKRDKDHGLLERVLSLTKEELRIPLVALTNVLFLERDDYIAQQCLVAIKNNEKLSDTPLDENEEYFLRSHEEMVALFEDDLDALENTLKIAGRCSVTIELGATHLPKFPTPSNESADEYLHTLCYEGLTKRMGEISKQYEERLTYELNIIRRMKFSDYFLIVWDFMKYAHENGIVTGPGRGSAAGSLVSYVLNITDVDPIEHRLLFERFLNPERITMPDIDIDFPDTRRDEVIQYVANKYGELHVAQIVTFGTLAAKAAIRDVGRVMGASPKETDILSKLIPARPGISLLDAIKESDQLTKLINEDPLTNKIIQTALKIEGLPRHTSTHAAGVVLSDRPLTDIVPIQDGQHNVYLTQFSMDYLEDLGLLKMDFLGLRNLSLIENIKKLILQVEGNSAPVANMSYQDQSTFSLLAAGDTTGVFQLESEGMRSVLKRLQPSSLEDIVAVNALYRPGPMENIPLFIDRKHHRVKIAYLHQALEPILKNTYGVIVYQEQIMEIASQIAGFSLGEADLLRRAVGKKKKEVLDAERTHFVEGCKGNGFSEEIANEVYDLIVKFANYGFNRSHAVAYSMIAYQLAYLKANYPLYFYTALLTSAIGNDEKIAQYIREVKQKGFDLLPPSINNSAFPFLVEKGAIRFSLAAVKSVGVAAIKEIFKARRQKSFGDLFDFCIRVNLKIVNRRTMEQLVLSGAMDEFEIDRASLLASLDVAIEHAELMKPSDENQFDLFIEEEFMLKPKYIEVEPFKIDEKLKSEKEALGFYFSSHPVEVYRHVLNHAGATLILDLPTQGGKASVGAMVISIRVIRTKKGENMAFLLLGDESGELDAVLFPQTYSKYHHLLNNQSLLFLKGKIEVRQDKQQLIIQEIVAVDKLPEPKKVGKLFLKINKESMEQQKLQEVKELLSNDPGQIPVYLYYEVDKKTVQLPKDYFVSANEQCIRELGHLLGNENVVYRP
ncbi:DNA polymerase III subunit alpha [Metabacillus sp. HB246100]|uniref:DNA polymerase III subunit alpha n=1 Tax=Bacillus weihaiensis TaxID=1547283 RepID=UPI002356C295|nr:DNA polymerase III subunit alpha [Bacillus weihaiensis]